VTKPTYGIIKLVYSR